MHLLAWMASLKLMDTATKMLHRVANLSMSTLFFLVCHAQPTGVTTHEGVSIYTTKAMKQQTLFIVPERLCFGQNTFALNVSQCI